MNNCYGFNDSFGQAKAELTKRVFSSQICSVFERVVLLGWKHGGGKPDAASSPGRRKKGGSSPSLGVPGVKGICYTASSGHVGW